MYLVKFISRLSTYDLSIKSEKFGFECNDVSKIGDIPIGIPK